MVGRARVRRCAPACGRAAAGPCRRLLLGALAACLLADVLAAQEPPALDLRGGLTVGSEAERYLRVLQVAGLAPLHPWTVRPVTPWIAERLPPDTAEHPWAGALRSSAADPADLTAGWVPAQVRVVGNSAFPHGESDGVLWAGRGLTAAVSAGAFLRLGPLHARITPEAFVSQNAGFDLTPNGLTGEAALRDPKYPGAIDRPQRFGEGAYGRLDPGDSWLALRLRRVVLGASTAAQQWGPAVHYPLMLGNNAGGFPHLFLGTSAPVPIGIGSLHGRWIAGRLDQSEWSPFQGEPRRFASAAVLVFRPRGLDGLELGVSRFSDFTWPEGGIAPWHVLRPFSGRVANPENVAPVQITTENQLAGGFLRWVLPSAGVEAYLELLREDFPRDLRHVLVEPDDLTTRLFGLQRVMKRPGGHLLSVRFEVVSGLVHHSERGDRFRLGSPHPLSPYYHGRVHQGHTQRGQILGSPTAYGGSGWTLGVDRYTPRGRWTAELFRGLREDWRRELATGEAVGVADVLYGLRIESVRIQGGRELAWTLAPVLNLNRDLVEGNSVFNLHVAARLRGLWR